jgi:pyridoxine 5-phosphate synthase
LALYSDYARRGAPYHCQVATLVVYRFSLVHRLHSEPMMRTKLSVNLNAVALLRNRRKLPWPSVTGMGAIALGAGADGLTVHPRPDQRHVRFADIPAIRALIDDRFPDREFNIEGFPSEEFLMLCIANEPEQVTLVPDDPEQPTSDHGWDFSVSSQFLTPVVARLRDKGIRVSLFANPDADEKQIAAAQATGAERVELYTGAYGASHREDDGASQELALLGRTADIARDHGLSVNAGHDLTVANLPDLVRRVPHLSEVSIGHGLTADALIHGMDRSVRRFIEVLQPAE